ncbi:MAG TPA: hypothetical protein PK264_22740, partial [Hyphomicrobiaceae bacterium]|nr:hypothetical protein [Hyphomicrobiaceae bacterium]
MQAADCIADEKLWNERYKSADVDRLKVFLSAVRCPAVAERVRAALSAMGVSGPASAAIAPGDEDKARREAAEKAKRDRDAAEAEAKRKAAA